MAFGDGAGRGAHRPAGQRTDRRSLLPAQRTLPAVDRQGRLDLRSLLRRRNADARLRTRPAGVPRSGHLCRRLPERNPNPDGGQHVPPLGRRSQTPAQGARQRTARLFPLPDQQGPAAVRIPALPLRGLERSGGQRGTRREKTQPLHPQGGLSLRLGLGSAAGYVGHLASGKTSGLERAAAGRRIPPPDGGLVRSRPCRDAGGDRSGCARRKRRRHRLRRQTGARFAQRAAPRGHEPGQRPVHDRPSGTMVVPRHGRTAPLYFPHHRGAGQPRAGRPQRTGRTPLRHRRKEARRLRTQPAVPAQRRTRFLQGRQLHPLRLLPAPRHPRDLRTHDPGRGRRQHEHAPRLGRRHLRRRLLL